MSIFCENFYFFSTFVRVPGKFFLVRNYHTVVHVCVCDVINVLVCVCVAVMTHTYIFRWLNGVHAAVAVASSGTAKRTRS